MSSAPQPSRSADALQRVAGALSTAAMTRMESDVPWFRDLSAADRSWVGLIVQAGIKGFVDWYRSAAEDASEAPLAAAVFGAAPRALTGVITLQQTVDLIRLTIAVVEANVGALLPAEDAAEVHAAVLVYGREVAFATAEVYARAAEVRGAWDARLEALVVDAILRAEADETVLSRANALGWADHAEVAVVFATPPRQRVDSDLFEEIRRRARTSGMDALCATQGEQLIVVLGGVEDPGRAAGAIADLLGPGPIVIGPITDGLDHAHLSARAASSAFRAAPGWPEAPRPVRSDELLPERVLNGDGHARRHLVDEVFLPLSDSKGVLIETLAAYFASGSSVEATARALFVHPNTVRYRLRQVAEVTGFNPTAARHALVLQIALVLGRQFSRVPSSRAGAATRR